ncbi:DegV family protein [Wenzhouxiangella limi]|uniref:DegV family EDD domain-containing protein n=1 Tax=Wenzhouxiangella limi TaxID=2707351 RepID=A0A845V4K7_9GAMM|nr:DegV family protein [Wenzhouxiangella limi]NDY94895.1 DegV family EDD domain-containing protein [Wenzhouxiangella limi]
MASGALAVTHVDASRLQEALLAGIANVLARRDYINKINVFPVPDGDTGTNLAFTLASVRSAIEQPDRRSLPELLEQIAEAALDGARGNSGAIMAQYFQGLSDSSRNHQVLDAAGLAEASRSAARSAWGAMSNPVPGTLPTVLEDFGDELGRLARDGVDDIRALFQRGLKRARQSLAATPEKLAVLREAGVVDAGAQGFVDFLEGISRYIQSGKVPGISEGSAAIAGGEAMHLHGEAPDEHRFCTECLIAGESLDVVALRSELEALDASSLVVAGGARRARVHIHTDSPGEVFRICGDHGEIRQQKADDMTRQHGLMNQHGQVAIVTDSAADLPAEEVDRLGINVVPVRLNFGDEEFLDKLTITPTAFYQRLAASTTAPRTSQPPPGDFRRQFELLTSHGLEVLALQISSAVSGTFQAAKSAGERFEGDAISVFDTLNGATGQGLMVLWAAEAAARGWERAAIIEHLTRTRAEFQTLCLVRDLSWGVRGGRIKPWMETVSRRLRLNLVLANTAEGKLGPRGVLPGRRNAVERFARFVLKKMDRDRVYRVIISHTDALEDARTLRDRLLTGHPKVDACWLEDASPAIGCHAGPGALLCGLHPWHAPEEQAK